MVQRNYYVLYTAIQRNDQALMTDTMHEITDIWSMSYEETENIGLANLGLVKNFFIYINVNKLYKKSKVEN